MSWSQSLFWFALCGVIFAAGWVRWKLPRNRYRRGVLPSPSDKCQRNKTEALP